MNLTHVQEGTEHIVKAIVTDDEEMHFFFLWAAMQANLLQL